MYFTHYVTGITRGSEWCLARQWNLTKFSCEECKFLTVFYSAVERGREVDGTAVRYSGF